MLTRFQHDPAVRDNGACVVCGKQREASRSSKYGKAEAEIDPFCSTQCCRQWYGTGVSEMPQRAVTEDV